MKTSIPSVLITFSLVSLGVSPQARAVCEQGCDVSKANTFFGENALVNNTGGTGNTAMGSDALFSNTTGENNTATGQAALFHNNTGIFNTANGSYALFQNTTGSYNTATGVSALVGNTSGSYNTANGHGTLRNNTTGGSNTAIGDSALIFNTIGYRNTVIGVNALRFNETGYGNTAIGFQALLQNTGYDNVALGVNAGSNNHGIGNVYIGANIVGVPSESNTTRIKNVYASVASDRAVYINSNNKIGTLVSSRRFKDEIKPMDKSSDAILALKPVTFRYKKEIEPNGGIMFGLIAEEVERVDPDLVTRNDKGEAETVRYDAVNAMLLNEFIKEHRKVEDLKKDFQATVAQLTAQLKEQAAQIQKVSAQLATASPSDGGLEASKPVPRVVNNP
jgi:hypothetical protein